MSYEDRLYGVADTPEPANCKFCGKPATGLVVRDPRLGLLVEVCAEHERGFAPEPAVCRHCLNKIVPHGDSHTDAAGVVYCDTWIDLGGFFYCGKNRPHEPLTIPDTVDEALT